MERTLLQILERSSSSFSPPPPPPPPPNSIQSSENGFNLDSKITPSILLIIVILAIIFFVSGLLHLLVRFLLRPSARNPDELDNVTALQGQLQQLFHLHDAGVDQAFIDTLPVFLYKAIIGVKDPFDCAVCLCEFEPEDKLRLLPKCSHAFHMECIDTWLLSHSTCPLCRASLLPDFSPRNSFTPIVCVLESGSDSSREIAVVNDRDVGVGRSNSVLGSNNAQLGCLEEGAGESGSSRIDIPRKSLEISTKEEVSTPAPVAVAVAGGGVAVAMGPSGEKIVTVKLGKFRNVDGSGGEGSTENNTTTGSSNNADGNGGNMRSSRRCYSMGSFAYVMDETSSLQVPIRTPAKKPNSTTKKPKFLPLKPGHRSAISEYGSDSRREFNGLEAFKSIEIHQNGSGNGGGGCSSEAGGDPRSKSERFSISKIWARGDKKDKVVGGNNNGAANANGESSKRTFSFRFPVRQGGGGGGGDVSRRTISEIEIDDGWENGGSESGWGDDETHSCYSMDSQAIPSSSSSTARRTLLWIMGRQQQQNKVVHPSFSSSSNV